MCRQAASISQTSRKRRPCTSPSGVIRQPFVCRVASVSAARAGMTSNYIPMFRSADGRSVVWHDFRSVRALPAMPGEGEWGCLLLPGSNDSGMRVTSACPNRCTFQGAGGASGLRGPECEPRHYARKKAPDCLDFFQFDPARSVAGSAAARKVPGPPPSRRGCRVGSLV